MYWAQVSDSSSQQGEVEATPGFEPAPVGDSCVTAGDLLNDAAGCRISMHTVRGQASMHPPHKAVMRIP